MADKNQVLKAVERVVVITAALLAVWPLMTWLWETEQRRLDRIGNLVQGASVCERLWLDHLSRRGEVKAQIGVFYPFSSIPEERREKIELRQKALLAWDQTQLKMSVLCNEIDVAIRDDRFASENAKSRALEVPEPQPAP